MISFKYTKANHHQQSFDYDGDDDYSGSNQIKKEHKGKKRTDDLTFIVDI